ncbi:hypothetical protein O181_003276 [Austropuccinia psidii MF-1]|uniref:DUF2433 domain-containing protein n=1 Tax=Austropuccinia psidii MF-1 TaxID=1389203 RepID=A0A9Q3BDI2_9BASI|nr:hypothetical protein [Austropuccinia psidii MF-1]
MPAATNTNDTPTKSNLSNSVSNNSNQNDISRSKINFEGPSNKVDLINSDHGRILCIADLRGKISQINQLAKDFNAVAVIHSGDFGFYEPSSLDRISDRTLRHLIQYSSLISSQFRSQLLAPSMNLHSIRQMILSPPQTSSNSNSNSNSTCQFPLSEFPDLLSRKLKLNVPVYTVWGACEDVAILEKIRASGPSPINLSLSQSDPNQSNPLSPYSIPNLTVLDEATTRCLVIGGVRLRLFGLGGAIVPHKLFDNGEGSATIAGGQGTMWTSVLQLGEVIDTAQRVYDPTETRLLVSHASPGREGLLAQLALVLKADLTISAGLHFRYGVSYNEFSVQHDQEAFRAKLHHAKATFNEIWDTVKNQVDAVIDDHQRQLLSNALALANRVPAPPPHGSTMSTEEPAWKNSWNWNLPDAAYGSLVLDIKEGRIGAEMRSQGFNFAYRSQAQPKPPTTSTPNSNPRPTPVQNSSTTPTGNQSLPSHPGPINHSISLTHQASHSHSSNQNSIGPKPPSTSNPHRSESSISSTGPTNPNPSRSQQQHGNSYNGHIGGSRYPNHFAQQQHRYSRSRDDYSRTHLSSHSASGPAPTDSKQTSAAQHHSQTTPEDNPKETTAENVEQSASTGQSASPVPSRKSSFGNKKKKSSGSTPTGTTNKTDTERGSQEKGDTESWIARNKDSSNTSVKESNEKAEKTAEVAESNEKSAKPSESHNPPHNGVSGNAQHYKGRGGSRGRGGPGSYNVRNNRGGRGGGKNLESGREGFNARPAGPGLVGAALAGAGIGNKSSNNHTVNASGTTGENK